MALRKLGTKTTTEPTSPPEVEDLESRNKPTKKALEAERLQRKRENHDKRFVDGNSHRLQSRLTSVLLSSIRQDPQNSRTCFISVGLRRRMTQFFQEKYKTNPEKMELNDNELAGFVDIAMQDPQGTPPAEIRKTIGDVWSFACHIKENELLQPFAIASDGKGGNRIVFGNVRFIAMCIAHGEQYSVECLQYASAPSSHHIRRFIENNTRNDVPLSAKIRDLANAISEIDEGEGAVSQVKIANQLGLSRAAYYKYKDILGCQEVVDLINNGKIGTLDFAQKAAKYRPKDSASRKELFGAIASQGQVLTDFSGFVDSLQARSSKPPPGVQGRAKGRPNKIKIPAIEQPIRLREILAPTVLEMDGWKDIDWEDTSKDNVTLIEKLVKQLLQPSKKAREQGVQGHGQDK